MDWSTRHRAATLLTLSSWACQPLQQQQAAQEEGEATAAAVINGADDRLEVYQYEPASDRELIERSVAALIWAHRIDYAAPTALRAVSAERALGICPDERFAQQPAAAFCSAALIDADLVLTAGHCLGDSLQEANDRCARLLVTFGDYYSAPGKLGIASADDIYACRRVAYHGYSASDRSFEDVAVLQLDRKVTAAREPLLLGSDRVRAGDALIAASHGAGLPLKVDAGGRVVETPPDVYYFVASTDSFEGGSGGPVFNEQLELVGYQVRGHQDWQADNGCYRAQYSKQPQEQHQLARFAVRSLCSSGWPSEALCQRATECGDGVCTGSETNQICEEDCPITRCGDGMCEPSERLECVADCSAYAEVPAAWMDDPAHFHRLSSLPSALSVTPKGGCSVDPRVPGSRWPALSVLALLAMFARRRAR